MSEKNSEPPIALALSGGGIRAMVFHLGVLRHLAEQGALERVSHISSVSGGSLVVGLLLQESGLRWPCSDAYLTSSHPRLREKLCSRSLMRGMIKQLSSPRNWRFMLSRANLLAKALTADWGVTGTLQDLPPGPEWSINGTTAETGKRFRFKRDTIGDYRLGYASADRFPLAEAMAVSAAFPGGIGPLVIRAGDYEWRKRLRWNDPERAAVPVKPDYARLHLYDGGVYDNLGLEPFLDTGNQSLKKKLEKDTHLIVSDAGAPLEEGFSLGKLNPFRMKRVLDMISDQARSLRVRTFYGYLSKTRFQGGYVYIANSSEENPLTGDALFAASFPTSLKQLTCDEFDRIERHGYACAKQDAWPVRQV